MSSISRWLRILATWIVVLWSIGIGVLGLVLVGTGQIFNWRLMLAVTGTLICALIPICCVFWGVKSRRNAAQWSLGAAIPAFALRMADSTWYRLGNNAEFAALLIAMSLVMPGLFWLLTAKFCWPELLTNGFRGWRRRVAAAGAVFAIAACVFYGLVLLALRMPRLVPYSCGSTSVVTSAIEADHAMFLAHRLFRSHKPEQFADYYSFWRPLWSLAVVDHEYWGLPSWKPRVILFSGSYDGQFLVDATRDHGLISGLLPLYINRVCGQSGDVKRAEAQLRVLREGNPTNGVRIIGNVFGPRESHVEVIVSGPQGELRTFTDDTGVYDVGGLPAGRYRIRLNAVDSRYQQTDQGCITEDGKMVVNGQVWGCQLRYWNPEGH